MAAVEHQYIDINSIDPSLLSTDHMCQLIVQHFRELDENEVLCKKYQSNIRSQIINGKALLEGGKKIDVETIMKDLDISDEVHQVDFKNMVKKLQGRMNEMNRHRYY